MAIKSYKGFDKNLRCRGFQYKIGGIYEMDGKIKMRKFENKADRHTFQKVFGNKRGNELWDYFLEVGRSIFILEDSYFLINDRNVFSLCLAECSDYDLYELVHNIDTDSDQGK